MKTLDDIKQIFFREKLPYWSLQSSLRRRESGTPDDIMAMADKEERLAASWAFLEDEVLPTCADGKMTLNLLSNKTGSKTKQVYEFAWGDWAPPVTPSVQLQRGAQIGGFSGGSIGGIAGFEFVAGLMNSGRNETDKLRDDLMIARLEIMEKKFENEALKKEVAAVGAAQGNNWDWVKGILTEHFPDILDRFVPAESRTAIATLRDKRTVKKWSATSEGEMKPPTPKGETRRGGGEIVNLEFDDENEVDAFDADEEHAVTGEISPKEVGARLQKIFQASVQLFPNHHPIEVLEEVIGMAQKPSFAFVVPMIDGALTKKKTQPPTPEGETRRIKTQPPTHEGETRRIKRINDHDKRNEIF